MPVTDGSIDFDANDIHDSNLGVAAGEALPESVQFCSIEDMQAASVAEGWTIDYNQIDPGGLTASTTSAQCADISLMDETADRRIEIVGESPVDHVTILAPYPDSLLSVNGLTMDGRGVILLEPDTDMQLLTGRNTHVVSMHIPNAMLREISQAAFFTWETSSPVPSVAIDLGAVNAGRLRRLMRATVYQPVAGRWQMERASALATTLIECIDSSAENPIDSRRMAAGRSWRTINCAREYIEANLSEALSIGNVCKNCAVSCSKLERNFRHELAMSPSQYILARRLNAVKRALTKSRSDHGTIGRIAMDFGFSHLGRFASAYRAHFGELPSETVRSS